MAWYRRVNPESVDSYGAVEWLPFRVCDECGVSAVGRGYGWMKTYVPDRSTWKKSLTIYSNENRFDSVDLCPNCVHLYSDFRPIVARISDVKKLEIRSEK